MSCSKLGIALGWVEIAENVHLVHGCDDHEEEVPAQEGYAVLAIQLPAIQMSGSQEERDG